MIIGQCNYLFLTPAQALPPVNEEGSNFSKAVLVDTDEEHMILGYYDYETGTWLKMERDGEDYVIEVTHWRFAKIDGFKLELDEF